MTEEETRVASEFLMVVQHAGRGLAEHLKGLDGDSLLGEPLPEMAVVDGDVVGLVAVVAHHLIMNPTTAGLREQHPLGIGGTPLLEQGERLGPELIRELK